MIQTSRIAMIVLVLLGMGWTQASAQQATTRIEGKITDPVTHKPVSCTISIVCPSGKKLKITSSDADGTYLGVLNESGMHKFSMVGFQVYRAEFNIDIPAATRFQEIKRDFEVRALVEGDHVAQTRGFERNKATLTSTGIAELKKVKEMLTTNQQMNVTITVMPDEDQLAGALYGAHEQYHKDSLEWVKEYKAWEKKYKKKKEKPEPPAAPVMGPAPVDPNSTLVSERKATVEAFMKDVKNSDLRVVVKTASLPASAVYTALPPAPAPTTTKSKKSKSVPVKTSAPQVAQTTHNTIIVNVGKVKRLFD